MNDPVEFLRARLASDTEWATVVLDDPKAWNLHGTARRFLVEADSKRLLLAAILAEPHATLRPGGSTGIYCAADGDPGEQCECGRDARASAYVRLLALPYASHPDYCEEWRP